jgi:hypothetical protein
MTQYYFAGTSLPPLAIGVKPELSFKDLLELLKENLTESDWKKVELLLFPVDLSNIRALWMSQPLDEKGLHTPKELEESLLVRTGLPEYLIDFLDRYESTGDRLRYFPSLYASMYKEWGMPAKNGFLKHYFILEREIRLVLTALRSKQLGRNIVQELQFEDPLDPFVMDILSQKDSPTYTPPTEFEELKALFQKNEKSPKKLLLALLEYQFDQLEQFDPFSIDRILSYTAQLMIVESWEGLKEESGKTIVEDLSKHG